MRKNVVFTVLSIILLLCTVMFISCSVKQDEVSGEAASKESDVSDTGSAESVDAETSADQTPRMTIQIGSAEADPGETVEIPVRLINNKAINSCRLVISYSEDMLNLTSVDFPIYDENDGTAMKSVSPTLRSPVTVNWLSGLKSVEGDTDFVILKFTVAKNAAGVIEINAEGDDENIFDNKYKNIPYEIVPGRITIRGYEETETAVSADTTDVSTTEATQTEEEKTTDPATEPAPVTEKEPETDPVTEKTEDPQTTAGPVEVPQTTEAQDPETTKESETQANRKLVAFTFDDGPHPQNTRKITDKMLEYNGKCTFFFIGNLIYGDRLEGVKYAYDHGMETAIHCWTHEHYYTKEPKYYHDEVYKTADKLKEVTGRWPTLMRPPGGNITEEQYKSSEFAVIIWDVDSEDWKHKSNKEVSQKENIKIIVNNIMKEVEPGSIILMHEIYENSYLAFCEVIDKLADQGYEFVTVSELLNNPQTGYKYYSANKKK